MPAYQARLTALWHRPLASAPPGPTSHAGEPPGTADPALSYLADLLADTREELTRADSKASLLLAAAGVILGALIAGLAGSNWTPLDLDSRIQWIWWLGVAAAAAGVLAIAASVYPRIYQPRIPHPGVPTYYGDVAAYRSVEAFRNSIGEVPLPKERLINQAFVLARIVQRKYVLLRRGLCCLLLAISACTLAVVINTLLSR
jgi:MFS family permease